MKAATAAATGVDMTATFTALARCRTRARQLLCQLTGGHELYRAHTDTKLYQQCLLCGHETAGFTIDRRDRRSHIRQEPQR